MRLKELKELLLARKYTENLIDRAVDKAKKIPRRVALFKMKKTTDEKRPVYDPRMQAIQKIQAKRRRVMKAQDQYQADVFKQPP